SRPCHSRFGSPISAGTQPPRCHIADKSKVGIADTLPDGAGAYPAYAVSARSFQRHHKKTAIRRNARWRF
ncbi:hypothetical protein, partial [Kosakonia cowanii]|uniref:hypothetical protein n=1 Tax=Kosakonia cowanii TaxID=208223 RepID=UPI00289FE5B2